ncbi:glycosyltransferase family 4 protein [Desulfopila inferna]|uniref:glycosyltransferase family 4 protein n=1 Tax=Desulfopila inferna TaxID=468528 RepID=UPI001963E616|nr:glycosyltransferase family 4 protein [Desulfopila inferna]MBM9602708.1 glycosyltransferase family 4 protein [Desulfopila inferna]
MKILVLAPQPFFQNRGTPIAVRMLIEDLQGAGHEVELLVFHEGEDVDLSDITIHRTLAVPGISNIGPGFSFKKVICDFFMLTGAVRLCCRSRYDMIHAVEESVFIAMILKLFFRIPYIYDIDSWLSDQIIEKFSFIRPMRGFFSFCENAAVRYSNGAVAVCKVLEEKVRGIDSRIPLLRLEDVSLVSEAECEYESLRDVVGSSGDILLYVGNLEKYQGIDLLLEAFRILSKKRADCCLVIIGGSRPGIEKYIKKAEELAILSQVFFIGSRPLDRLGMYLRQADLLVSPRVDGENTPMKIYSYMASGIPIVATRITSHTQVLDDSTALLAEPDGVSMAESFMQGLADKRKSAGLAASAVEKVENEYSRSAFQFKLTRFYSELSNVWNLRI